MNLDATCKIAQAVAFSFVGERKNENGKNYP